MDTGFHVAGPVALWPSHRNTFRLLREAKAYLRVGAPRMQSSLTCQGKEPERRGIVMRTIEDYRRYLHETFDTIDNWCRFGSPDFYTGLEAVEMAKRRSGLPAASAVMWQ